MSGEDGAEKAGENMKCMMGGKKMEEMHGGGGVERFEMTLCHQPSLPRCLCVKIQYFNHGS